MKIKLCICVSSYENAQEYKTDVVQWHKNELGVFETRKLKDDEMNSAIRCQCGKYMNTRRIQHSHHDKYGNVCGKPWYEMIAMCSCGNPKPEIMEIYDKYVTLTQKELDDDEYISMTQKELDERDHYNWVCGFNRRLKNESIHKHLDCIKDLI